MGMNHLKLKELVENYALIESSQVQKLVLKEVKIINEEQTYLRFLHEEGNRMKSLGHNREEINEALTDMFSGFLGQGMDAAIDTMKSYIINYLLKMLGLDPAQPGSWGILGCAISNTLEELDVATFKKLFSGTKEGYSADGLKGIWPNICNDLVDLIMRGLTECLTEKAQRSKIVLKFYSVIVGDTTVEKAQDSVLWKTSDEMLQNFINNTQLMTNFRAKTAEWLCAIDVSEMYQSGADALDWFGDKIKGSLGLDKLIPGAATSGT